MKTLTNPFVFLLNIIEFFDRLFRRRAPQEVETFPQFENDNRELIKKLSEREPVVEVPEESEEFMPVFENDARQHSPEIRAPKGIALQKSIQFLTRRGIYLSAKVVGYSWEDPRTLILSRNGGPLFRRRLC